ncbi:sodium/glutamate symporter [Ruegeria sp. HKCCD7559]|uniref:sodium/glutamate symporter n=1 Tax=Ruegeria sp. HKCCD7559 TaxID=2683005 RepID=UPI001490B3EE|nr:sodium/glutamate symporter [Ruegeria sp. HKCCD7559]NOC43903.1 sodium/glutamate symporter [Ruegeria sp. HKCCD7559]
MVEPIVVDSFIAVTLGIVVYFLGSRLTERFELLRKYSIPEPVSGGLLAALVTLGVVTMTGREVIYDLASRDSLLIYFFTTIGLNARFSDLVKGGPLLGVMLVLTIGYMFVQNGIGVLGASLFGLPSQAGVMMGTTSLIGGHGTAIAWGPVVEEQYAVAGAAELGIAAATIGLIMASLIGGPIASYLIARDRLEPSAKEKTAISSAKEKAFEVTAPTDLNGGPTNPGMMRAILWTHVAIVIGYIADESLELTGANLPLFVPCLLSGILLANLTPRVFPKIKTPTGTASLQLLQDFSLAVFLSMSLMSMQLWTLAGSAGVLAITMTLQAAAAAAFIIFVVYRTMGRNYFAGVMSAGFAGFALGATPTAIANMTAVTHKYGPSPLAFIVLPLVSAFFVDIANAFIIQLFVSNLP